MAKKSESESKREQPERKPKLNEEQYKILKSCSEKKDISEWNLFRKEHPDEEIWLEGANLSEAHLEDAELQGAHLEGANLMIARLEGADYAREMRPAPLEYCEITERVAEASELKYFQLEIIPSPWVGPVVCDVNPHPFDVMEGALNDCIKKDVEEYICKL